MSAAVRVPLDEAREIARALVKILGPACTTIKIAGSIRRQRESIGDIDLVCEPLLIPTMDLFDEPNGPPIDALHELCDALVSVGQLGKRLDKNGRPTWGHQLKRATFQELNVDIQAVIDSDTFGMWMLIRTGPADLNKAIVTPRRQGGLLPPGFEIKDGFQVWKWGERIPTPTEKSAFEALGLPYVEPALRGTATAASAADGGQGGPGS